MLAQKLPRTELQRAHGGFVAAQGICDGQRDGMSGHQRGARFDADAQGGGFEDFPDGAPVDHQRDGGAHGATTTIGLREHFKRVALLQDGGVALILPRCTRQRADGDRDLRQQGAFSRKGVCRLHKPVTRGIFRGARRGMIDHAGMATVQDAQIMRCIGKIGQGGCKRGSTGRIGIDMRCRSVSRDKRSDDVANIALSIARNRYTHRLPQMYRRT